MTAPESVACKVPHYPYPAVEKFSDSVLSAERCIQSQGLTTECGSKGLTAMMSGQTMVQMRPSDASSHIFFCRVFRYCLSLGCRRRSPHSRPHPELRLPPVFLVVSRTPRDWLFRERLSVSCDVLIPLGPGEYRLTAEPWPPMSRMPGSSRLTPRSVSWSGKRHWTQTRDDLACPSQFLACLVESPAGGVKPPQYFVPGVAGDHGAPIAMFFQVGGILFQNNLPANAHGNAYADPNVIIPIALETVETDGGAFNVREAYNSVNTA